jgi:hypothetical protein
MVNARDSELVQQLQGLSIRCPQDAFHQQLSQVDLDGLQSAPCYDETQHIDYMDIDVSNLNSVKTCLSPLDLAAVRKRNSRGARPKRKRRDKECSKIRKRAQKIGHIQNVVWVASLASRLAEYDLATSFAYKCEKILTGWISLLRWTTLPENTASSDACILTAFQKVDSIIRGDSLHLLRRLAYVQLIRVFSKVESIIKTERDTKRMHREPSYRNSSIAIDIYMNAQDSCLHDGLLRRDLRERKRIGSRWNSLAVASPLFILLYKDSAESLVYAYISQLPSSEKPGLTYTRKDFKKTDNSTLKLVASKIHEACPYRLLRACSHIDNAVDTAIKMNLQLNMAEFTAARIKHLLFGLEDC